MAFFPIICKREEVKIVENGSWTRIFFHNVISWLWVFTSKMPCTNLSIGDFHRRKHYGIPEISSVEWNSTLRNFPEKKTTSRGIPEYFVNFLPVTFLPFDFWLSGSHFRNSTILGIFLRKFSYQLSLDTYPASNRSGTRHPPCILCFNRHWYKREDRRNSHWNQRRRCCRNADRLPERDHHTRLWTCCSKGTVCHRWYG